mmetsp:Transcript_24346/g.29948  ORF Transcript_24346/g.29948 Transcript_24346/m.29948 type:complete len:540 (+) Transcript_24346:114-1733(+)
MSNSTFNFSGGSGTGTPSWSSSSQRRPDPLTSPPLVPLDSSSSNKNGNGGANATNGSTTPSFAFNNLTNTTVNGSGIGIGIGMGMGSGTRSHNANSASKSSISFPKQSVNNYLSPAASTSAVNNFKVAGGVGGSNNVSGSNLFTSGSGIASNTHTTSSPRFNFSSPSVNTTTNKHSHSFQPNGLLSRRLSPSPSGSTPSTFDFAGSTNMGGLRRRTNVNINAGGSSSASASTIPFHSSSPLVNNRPPLPKMTRLAMSSDAPDDYKENVQVNTNIPINNNQKQTSQSSTLLNNNNNNNTNPKTTFSNTNYATWVIVYGFTNSLEYKTVHHKFESFGKIVDIYPSTLGNNSNSNNINQNNGSVGSFSNWVCIQYEHSLEASKARCQNGSFIHIVGNSSTLNDNHNHSTATTSNVTGGNMAASNMKDDIVIIGVMQIDDNIAMKLGLKNYLELGSTGIERIGRSSHSNISIGGSGKKNVGGESSKKKVQFASIYDDDDIILMDDNQKGNNRQISSQVYYGGIGSRRDGGVCEQIMSWVFSWD